jgi:hypothetical protein
VTRPWANVVKNWVWGSHKVGYGKAYTLLDLAGEEPRLGELAGPFARPTPNLFPNPFSITINSLPSSFSCAQRCEVAFEST